MSYGDSNGHVIIENLYSALMVEENYYTIKEIDYEKITININVHFVKHKRI